MNTGAMTAAQEWRRGWTVVFAASLGFSFFSVMLSGAGIFMEPLGKDFGWSRTILSAGPSIATTTTAVLSPFAGVLIDRWGARRLALPGLVLTIASCAAFGLANGSTAQWMALWLCFGLTSTLIKSTVWNAAVVGLFDKGRGLALGLTLAGTAVSQVIVPPLGNALIGMFGWRLAYFWLAAGWGGLTLLVCAFLFFDLRDLGRRGRTIAIEAGALAGLSVQQAWRSSALWRLALSTFLIMVVTTGLSIHLFEILREAGIGRAQAALLTGITGIAGIVGKLATGALLDRYRPNWVGGLTMAVTALAFFSLMQGLRSPAMIMLAMVVNGYAAGTKMQITGFLVAGYGGMRNFGKIYGMFSTVLAAASGLGPLMGGVMYDRSGGYQSFLLVGGACCLVGGALIASLPRTPRWDVDEEAALFG